jgi:hypothetical protein
MNPAGKGQRARSSVCSSPAVIRPSPDSSAPLRRAGRAADLRGRCAGSLTGQRAEAHLSQLRSDVTALSAGVAAGIRPPENLKFHLGIVTATGNRFSARIAAAIVPYYEHSKVVPAAREIVDTCRSSMRSSFGSQLKHGARCPRTKPQQRGGRDNPLIGRLGGSTAESHYQ